MDKWSTCYCCIQHKSILMILLEAAGVYETVHPNASLHPLQEFLDFLGALCVIVFDELRCYKMACDQFLTLCM